MKRPDRSAMGAMFVEIPGLPQSMVAIEKREGVYVGFDLGDAVETGGHKLSRADAALANFGGRFA
jgi:hypothetical protein